MKNFQNVLITEHAIASSCFDGIIFIMNNKFMQQGVQGLPVIFSTELITAFPVLKHK